MDLNGDGHIDVTSGQYMPAYVHVWYGTKDGFGKKQKLPGAAFEEKNATGLKVAMATANFVDWDGDGDLDIVAGDVRGGVSLIRNNGTAKKPRFDAREQVQVAGKPMRVDSKSDPLPVDWDGDGKLDLLVGTEAGDVIYFRGEGKGNFKAGVSVFTGKVRSLSYRAAKEEIKADGIKLGYRLRVEVHDWNGDGRLDLLVGNCVTKDKKTEGYVYVFLRGGERAEL